MEMGETAIQPVPAQTADLSISGLRFVASPCTKAVENPIFPRQTSEFNV